MTPGGTTLGGRYMKGLGFHQLKCMKGQRILSFWSAKKPKIKDHSLLKGLTDALYWSLRVDVYYFLYCISVMAVKRPENTFWFDVYSYIESAHLQQLKGMQNSTFVNRRYTKYSRYLFLPKIGYKRVKSWTSGWSLPRMLQSK